MLRSFYDSIEFMTRSSELGKRGENFACEYLERKGYKIIERNFREFWGELDIVALQKDKTLVFIEVKTMSDLGARGLRPEDQMSVGKISRFKKVAMLYAGAHQNLIRDDKGWRLDVIGLTKKGEDFLINHYENIQ